MQLARMPVDAGHQPAFVTVTAADRGRLSGPGLRAFRAIAEAWGLSEAERIKVLGHPGRSTYHAWLQKAVADRPMTLPHDTLLRISAILGIYKGIAILFADPAQGLRWLKEPHRGTVFMGSAPMTFVIDAGIDGMLTVRRYLDAWRGGETGHGAPEGSITPVTAEDLVFL